MPTTSSTTTSPTKSLPIGFLEILAARVAACHVAPRAAPRPPMCHDLSYEAAPGNAFRERNMAKEYAAVQPATRPPATAQ